MVLLRKYLLHQDTHHNQALCKITTSTCSNTSASPSWDWKILVVSLESKNMLSPSSRHNELSTLGQMWSIWCRDLLLSMEIRTKPNRVIFSCRKSPRCFSIGLLTLLRAFSTSRPNPGLVVDMYVCSSSLPVPCLSLSMRRFRAPVRRTLNDGRLCMSCSSPSPRFEDLLYMLSTVLVGGLEIMKLLVQIRDIRV